MHSILELMTTVSSVFEKAKRSGSGRKQNHIPCSGLSECGVNNRMHGCPPGDNCPTIARGFKRLRYLGSRGPECHHRAYGVLRDGACERGIRGTLAAATH